MAQDLQTESTMPGHPQIADFAAFKEVESLNEVENHTCIYYLIDKRRRCLVAPSRADIARAQNLRRSIISNVSNPSLEDLRTYAMLNCCKRFHRTKLEDFELLDPLVEKWQKELRDGQWQTAIVETTAQMNPSTDLVGSAVPSSTSSSLPQASHQYNLRSRTSTQGSSATTQNVNSPPISTGFKPHQISPSQTVASLLMKNLTTRDHKTGSLYLFTRTSSPGHIKIGVTQQTVKKRLGDWQRQCGYVPNLVTSFLDVPHVYRVESLVHFELAQYWRTEIRCSVCPRQHQEWFEVATDVATEVAKKYADWMKVAQPFGEDGCLELTWKDEVYSILSRKGHVAVNDLIESLHKMQTQASKDEIPQQNSGVQVTNEANDNTNQRENDVRRIANAILALTVDQRHRLALALESRQLSQQNPASLRSLTLPPTSLDRNIVRCDTNSLVMALA